MDRNPIDIDDPRLTAYALGELPAHEVDEFERRLEVSPLAQKELEATTEMVGLLSAGLESEWNAQIDGPAPAQVSSANVVAAQFGTVSSRKRGSGLAIAAALAAMIGIVFFVGGRPAGTEGLSWAGLDTSAVPNSVDDGSIEFDVPELLLTEEVSDGEGFRSASWTTKGPVDASYLDAGQVIKTSHRPASGGFVPAAGSLSQWDARPDSYLPNPVVDRVGDDALMRSAGMRVRELSRIASTLVGGGESAVLTGDLGSVSSPDRLVSDAHDMHEALSELALELHRIDGEASPQQVERLRKQLDQMVEQSRELAGQLSTVR